MPTSLLERSARWLKDRLDATAAVGVDYIVDAHAMEDLKAVPGNSDYRNVDVADAQASSKSFDWIVAANEIFVNGAKVEPASGHLIRYVRTDGKRALFEVLPDATERCFSVCDQLGVLYRVHTKFKGFEPTP